MVGRCRRDEGKNVVSSTTGEVVARHRRSTFQPGKEDGLTWNPLEGVRTFRHALRVARDVSRRVLEEIETDFWNSLATKIVAALMVLALEEVIRISSRRRANHRKTEHSMSDGS